MSYTSSPLTSVRPTALPLTEGPEPTSWESSLLIERHKAKTSFCLLVKASEHFAAVPKELVDDIAERIPVWTPERQIREYLPSDVLRALPSNASLEELERALVAQVYPWQHAEDRRSQLSFLLKSIRNFAPHYRLVLDFLVKPSLLCNVRDEILSKKPFGEVPASELPPVTFIDVDTFLATANSFTPSPFDKKYERISTCPEKLFNDLHAMGTRRERDQSAAQENKQRLDLVLDIMEYTQGIPKNEMLSAYEAYIGSAVGTCESALEEMHASMTWINRANDGTPYLNGSVERRLAEAGHDIEPVVKAMEDAVAVDGTWTLESCKAVLTAWKNISKEAVFEAHKLQKDENSLMMISDDFGVSNDFM